MKTTDNTIQETRADIRLAFLAVGCDPATTPEAIAGAEHLRCELFYGGVRRPVWFRRGSPIVVGGIGPLAMVGDVAAHDCRLPAIDLMARRHANWLAAATGRGPRFCEITGKRIGQPA